MFFAEDHLSLELLGVFKIERFDFRLKSFQNREYDSLSLRIDGQGMFNLDDKTIKVGAGDILYIPKSQEYSQSSASETLIAIHFLNYTFDKANKFETLHIENSAQVNEIFIKMYNIWKEKNRGYRLQCTALLYELLFLLHKETMDLSIALPHNKNIEKAVSYIHKNFRSETIDVSRLAEMCYFSEQHFRRVFKQFYSVSPKQYIINLKIEYAAQLLQSRLYSVQQVSEKCGFEDVKYFSRIFKKYMKFSPKDYMANRLDINPIDLRLK